MCRFCTFSVKGLRLMTLVGVLLAVTSCYHSKTKQHDALAEPETSLTIAEQDSVQLKRQQDSLTFTSHHHYTNNYNFLVNTDSLTLLLQQPEELVSMGNQSTDLTLQMDTDSVEIYHGERLVVAEIRIVPTDSIDSVWVQLARDQYTFGWIHESSLLEQVVPDDPISQFISLFSDRHLLYTLIIVGLIIVAYIFRIIIRKSAKIVHFNDISSFYPLALVLCVSLAATVYATIQVFAPEMWRHFYYHPTLNPFSVPLLLCIFLMLVWMLPILGVAAVDDVRHHLPIDEAVLYLCGLSAVCLVDYIIFSVTTLYFVGYPLLAAYFYYSIRSFNRTRRLTYFCGSCGKAMQQKGVCPHCGALNV